MIQTTFLQIGDIHYPDIKRDVPISNIKDPRFPPRLIEILPPSSFNVILKDFLIELDKDPKAIFFAGDLTSRGQIDGYKDCLEFIKEKIPQNYFDINPVQRLFIVPGNHDVDRKNVSSESLLIKFKSINKCMENINFPKIPTDDIITENFNKDHSVKILLIGMNSCVGCGEIEYIPKEIKSIFLELFDKIDKEDNESNIELLNTLNNNLDTPLISAKDIDDMFRYIDEKIDYLPIILIHHNILPQNRPKIAIYSELLNSGYFREKLLTLNRPILILHGHLHDDPIEIIYSPKYIHSKIICISAPLFFHNTQDNSNKVGYNKIKIISSNNGQPIGCEIEHHLFNGTGIIKSTEKINFWTPPESIAFSSIDDRKILSYICGQKQYLNDIKEKNNATAQPINEVDLINSIERLSWLGLVKCSNEGGPKDMMCIEKVCP